MSASARSPLISVCIPVYNGADFIEVAINSVLAQTFSDFEVIIIDNKSTDNTLGIIKKYNDERIRIIENNVNIGLIPNWNKAIEASTGEYIKILPADDFIYPECLMLQSNILKNDTNKSISIVTAGKHVVNDKGKILFSRGYSKREMRVPGEEVINRMIRTGCGNLIGEAGVVMFRKEIIKKTGPFNSDLFYVLDVDMWFKMLVYGDLYVLPNVLGAFRISESSASLMVVKTQKRDVTAFMNKIYNHKEYKLSMFSYKLGVINVAILTFIKKILYKVVL